MFDGLKKLLRKILGIDMEAAAIGKVADTHGMPFLFAKAVVDFADLQKGDHFREYAAFCSAKFILDFLLDTPAGQETA